MKMPALFAMFMLNTKSCISIGDILRWKHQQQRHTTVTIVLALATLGDAAKIEMILIAKARKEGNIALQYGGHFRKETSPM